MLPDSAAPTNYRAEYRRQLWHAAFRCPTRVGLDAALGRLPSLDGYAAIYIDVDGLNALNQRHGQTAVDAMIAAAWDTLSPQLRRSPLRRRDVWGQWKGGDEFAVLVAGDAMAVAARVRAAFAAAGLGVSMAATPIRHGDVVAAMAAGEAAVRAARGGARGAGQRGVLIEVTP
jgi:GGDEF domain-containing protein